jgi:hypothetical protein
MRTPLTRPRRADGLSPFERLKLDLESVDCDTGLLWWAEIGLLPAVLAEGEKMEAIESCQFAEEPALAVITDRRLLVVSKTNHASVPHGATTRLEAKSDWAGDVTFRFVHPRGELVLEEVSELSAPQFYRRLHDLGRVPDVSAKQHLVDKLRRPKQPSAFRLGPAFPDPTAALKQLQHRWVLKAITETGPRRRSLPWVAHALFLAIAGAAALVVLAIIALAVTAIVVLVIYA